MRYNPLFNKCIEVIFRNEGGYVFHSADPGGETNMGITDRLDGIIDGLIDIDGDKTGDVEVKNMSKEQAKQIYYRVFWLQMNLWLINDERVVLQIFDFGINAGIKRAIKTAQKIACVKVDGIMGRITAKAINEYDGDFLKDYKHARKVYYEYLADKKPKLRIFLNGWLNRVEYTNFVK